MPEQVAVTVRHDGESWAAWSPQCPGLAVVQPTAQQLRDAVPDALAFFDGAEDRDPQFHLEQGLHGVVVRVAQDRFRWERQLLAERVATALGVHDQAESMRAAPANSLGDVVYVCALPSDTAEWVMQQREDHGDALNVVLPVADELIWSITFASAADGTTARTVADLGYHHTRRDHAGRLGGPTHPCLTRPTHAPAYQVWDDLSAAPAVSAG